MKLADTSKAASLMLDVLADDGRSNKVMLGATVYPTHKRLIEALARQHRATQADVVRAIIDEWCTIKLHEEQVAG